MRFLSFRGFDSAEVCGFAASIDEATRLWGFIHSFTYSLPVFMYSYSHIALLHDNDPHMLLTQLLLCRLNC